MSSQLKIVSDTPSAVWVDTKDIQNRFDATYFSAQFLRLDDILTIHDQSEITKLGTLLADPRRIMYLNTETFAQDDLPDGIRFISGIDLDESTMSIDWKTVTRVAPWMLERYPGGKLFDGALLIKVKGPNQLATYVEKAPFVALVSGTFVMAGVQGIDPWYLTSYLTEGYAQAWRTRLRQNITVEFTPYDELAEIPVIVPDPQLQRAIGNMLRKAARLRTIAAEAQEAFESWIARAARSESCSEHLLSLLGNAPDSTRPDSSWVTEFDPVDRVDPWPHHVAPRTVRRHLEGIAGARRFDHYFSIFADRRTRSASSSPDDHHISILHVGADGYIDWDGARLERVEGDGMEVFAGDILYSLLNPKETRVGYVPSSFQGSAVASTEFAILKMTDDFATYPHLLCAVLRSNWVRVQSTFLTRSSSLSRRRLQEVDLFRLLIPWTDDGATEVNERLALATSAKIESAGLIQRARRTVQELINGNLNPVALKSAGEHLEEWLKQHAAPKQTGGL